MRNLVSAVLITAAIATAAFVAVPEKGYAAEPGDVLRRACAAVSGQFEEVWTFEPGQAYWSETASCITAKVRVTCRDEACRTLGNPNSDRPNVLIKHKVSEDLGIAIPAERREFDRVLREIAIY